MEKPNSSIIKKKLTAISDLPTLPQVAQKILQMTQNPDTNLLRLSGLIQEDPAIMGKVLKLANSSFYGFPKKITCISQALIILGFSQLRNLIMTISVLNIGKNKKHNKINFDVQPLWVHSLGTGIIAQSIARFYNHPAADTLYIAGVLHDIGKVISFLHLSTFFTEIITHQKQQNCLLYESEMEILGFGHEQIGCWLLEQWNLPPEIVNPIRYHHQPFEAKGDKMPAHILHLSDIVTRALMVGNGGDNSIPYINDLTWSDLDLNNKTLEQLVNKSYESINNASDFFTFLEQDS